MSIPPNKHPGRIPSASTARAAFTLLEVLAALSLCVLLASVAATAVVQSGRAARRAIRLQDQALRLIALHAGTRLHPDLPAEGPSPSPSSPWRVSMDERLTPPPAPSRPPSRLSGPFPAPLPPRRWTLLTLRDAEGLLPPVQLAILETAP